MKKRHNKYLKFLYNIPIFYLYVPIFLSQNKFISKLKKAVIIILRYFLVGKKLFRQNI